MAGFRPGDLIFRAKPYAYVLSNEFRGQRCDYCFTKKERLKRCGGCSYLYFCDRNCQTSALDEYHKVECKLLKKTTPNELPADVFLLSRILFKIKQLGVDEPVEEIFGHKMNIRRLMSHSDEIDEELLMTFDQKLRFYLGANDVPSLPNLRVMIGKINTNVFNMLKEDLRVIGRGIYLGPSIFDHSCEPNAVFVFNGLEISIRAIKEIPHRDVTKIYISYIDPLQLLQDRQNFLKEHYFFTCQCHRCTSPYYEDLMTKILVDETQCGSMLSEFKKKIACIAQMVKNKAKPSVVYDACMDVLQKQENILADTHIYHIEVMEFALAACIENRQWTEANIIGKSLTEPYKLLYEKYHPNIGLHFQKLAAIENSLKLFKTSKQSLYQAAEVLKITHGVHHPLYKVILNDYNQCW